MQSYHSSAHLSPLEVQKKIIIGSVVVWGILLVSLGASFLYWYILAGLEKATSPNTLGTINTSSSSSLSDFWQFLLWIIVAVGVVAEVIKKVTLSTFRHSGIWLTATFVSVVTVMGSYSILDANRESELRQASDQYQSHKAQQDRANKIKSEYAWIATQPLIELETEKTKIVDERAKRKIRYATYLQLKEEIEKKIQARRKYDSAVATLASSSHTKNSYATTNPLLKNVAGFLGFSEELIKSVFYLLVTLLLEISAFYIGGQVETLRNSLRLTKAQILDIQVQEMYGYSLSEVNALVFSKVVENQRDQLEAEEEIKRLRQDKSKPPSLVARTVDKVRKELSPPSNQNQSSKTPPLNRGKDQREKISTPKEKWEGQEGQSLPTQELQG